MGTANRQSIAHREDAPDLSSNSYSVQGERVQRELDNATHAANKYKLSLRGRLQNIKAAKQRIANSNCSRLRVEEFDIDCNLRQRMRDEVLLKKEQIQNELAWNSEKTSVGLQKLKNEFFEQLVVEKCKVSSFCLPNICCSTLRTKSLPQWIQGDIAR